MLQRLGLAVFVAAIGTLAATSLADATTPTNGGEVPGAIETQGTVAHAPFSSGQLIDISVPANSFFSSHTNINVVECSAPGGVIPTDPSTCDGNTIQGNTVKPATDGSVTLKSYPLYAIPDSTSLGEGVSGPTCNATTQCILYIGDDQTDFTQPHVWSSPFYIVPNANDAGTNPGDGSAPSVTTTDPTTSTVAAAPEAAAADGKDPVTVTVTLVGTNGNPVPGDDVTLTAASGHSTIVPTATPNPSNSEGQATFTVTDATPETVVYAAKDTTANISVTQTASVDFETVAANATNSSVAANPTTVPAGGTTTITVTLRDQARNPQPVAGQTVTLNDGNGHAVITPAANPNVTDASGEATFTANDAVAESVTFTATDVSASNMTLAQTVSVTFGSLTVSASMSTVKAGSPASVTPPGVGTAAVVTLLTAGGSPVPGKQVTLVASSSNAVVGGPATTNTQGEATFTVTDPDVESVKLTATDTTDGNLVILNTAMVSFETSTPSDSQSTITAGATTAPADGQTQVLITVTINDQFGQALKGKTVTLTPNPSNDVVPIPIAVGSTTPGQTDPKGEAEFTVDNEHAEAVTFTATDTTDNVTLTNTVTITFGHTAADPNASIVAAFPAAVPSDGSTASTVTVTLTDFFGNPISGKTIALTAEGGNSTIKAVSATTDDNGSATFSVTDSTAEVVTYDVEDSTDSVTLAEPAVVTFGNPPAPPPVPSDCVVIVQPTSVPADGATTATISVQLNDGDASTVPGKTVSVTPSGGNSKVSAVNATTDNGGNASFTVSDATAESVTYTVTDTTDSVALSDEPVTVTFVPASGTTTSTTTTTTTGTGSSSSSTTTTTTSVGSTTTSTTSGAGADTASSSSTTTTLAATTATTTGIATQAASDPSGTSSPTSSSGNSPGVTLAFTGASRLLPWFVGLGALLVVIGTMGRRRYREETA